LNQQTNPRFWDGNFVSEIIPSLQPQGPAALAIDPSPWALVNLHTSQTNMSITRADERCLYACCKNRMDCSHGSPAFSNQLAVPDRGMTASSSSWNHLTAPSRSSVDVNSDGYQEVQLPAAAPGADVQLCNHDDPFGDLVGLKSDQPTRRLSDEPAHSNGRKRKITQRKVEIAPMPAFSRQQSLLAKSTKGKRTSPLSEEGRRNAEAVRKNGGQCIRCRRYKAKVFTTSYFSATPSNKA
jgi:hypothetical protein